MKNSILKYLAMGSIFIILSACSLGHKNPLSRINKDDSARFLADASFYAGVKIKKNLGAGYEKCMDQKLDRATCKKLYDAMLAYAKTKPLFKNLTYSDLTDFDVYQKLKQDYLGYTFEELPLPPSAYK